MVKSEMLKGEFSDVATTRVHSTVVSRYEMRMTKRTKKHSQASYLLSTRASYKEQHQVATVESISHQQRRV